jgi:hypothetical protein
LYNPSLHQTKQALFRCAVVSDLRKHPLPPPHPELLKYFNTPRRVIKRARDAVEECKDVLKVREGESLFTIHSWCWKLKNQVPKKIPTKVRCDGHAHAEEEDDGSSLLLDQKPVSGLDLVLFITVSLTFPQAPVHIYTECISIHDDVFFKYILELVEWIVFSLFYFTAGNATDRHTHGTQNLTNMEQK